MKVFRRNDSFIYIRGDDARVSKSRFSRLIFRPFHCLFHILGTMTTRAAPEIKTQMTTAAISPGVSEYVNTLSELVFSVEEDAAVVVDCGSGEYATLFNPRPGCASSKDTKIGRTVLAIPIHGFTSFQMCIAVWNACVTECHHPSISDCVRGIVDGIDHVRYTWT